MSETALALAFKAAGIEPEPWARALGVAAEAWSKWSGAEMGGARRDFVVSRLQFEMTWALVDHVQPSLKVQMVGALLKEAKELIASQKPISVVRPVSGGGQAKVETQQRSAPSDSSNAAQAAGDRQGSYVPHQPDAVASTHPAETSGSQLATNAARPRELPPTAPNLKLLADKQAAAGRARVVVEQKLSRLDTIKIDGVPIGDCSVAIVRAWATRRQADQRAAGRDARFALALIANLPSGGKIRDWWKDADEVDAIYSKAEAEYAE